MLCDCCHEIDVWQIKQARRLYDQARWRCPQCGAVYTVQVTVAVDLIDSAGNVEHMAMVDLSRRQQAQREG